MSDFNMRLEEALRTVEPGPAPVGAVMARGRKLRARRRIAAAAGVAAVAVAVAAGYPALAHKAALPVPTPVTQHERITVNPPGHGAPEDLIASGTIGGKPWAVSAGKPGPDQAGPGQQCFYGSGAALQADAAGTGCITMPTPGEITDPVQFEGAVGGNVALSFGAVRPDVDHVTVEFADGTLLTLRPMDLYAERYVAFPSPIREVIATVTAYSRSGEIAVAIPFMTPDGMPAIVAWLRPGERGHTRAAGTLFPRTATGVSATVTAYEGPWGTCFVTVSANDDSSGCVPGAPLRKTAVIGSGGGSSYGSAAPAVSYMTVTLAGGGSVRVSPVTVGDERLWAFDLPAGQTPKRWIAYDASGHRVASGAFYG